MNQPRRVTKVRTPGVPVPQEQPDDGAETNLDALAADTSDIEEPAVASDAVAGVPADLKAYIDAQIAAGVAAGLSASGVRKPAPPQVLPDQDDVNPDTIQRMTLTRQGWVVPTKLGAVPERLATRLMGV